MDLGSFRDPFLAGFWNPGPFKMSLWCRRGANFQKFLFFLPDVFLDCVGIRFGATLGSFFDGF